jgi:hypothetical protein
MTASYRSKPLLIWPGTMDGQCISCGKPLRLTTKKAYFIHLIDGGGVILHPEDTGKYDNASADLGLYRIGTICARKIGLRWTTSIDLPYRPTRSRRLPQEEKS